jgi:hypothetical protein
VIDCTCTRYTRVSGLVLFYEAAEAGMLRPHASVFVRAWATSPPCLVLLLLLQVVVVVMLLLRERMVCLRQHNILSGQLVAACLAAACAWWQSTAGRVSTAAATVQGVLQAPQTS